MNRFIQFVYALLIIAASSSSIAASTPSAEQVNSLNSLIVQQLRDLKETQPVSSDDVTSLLSSLLENAGLSRTTTSTPAAATPTLQQIFSVLPRPPIVQGPFIVNRVQAALDVSVIQMVSSSLSLASSICNAAATVISIGAGQVSLGIAEWNVVAATANSLVQSYQLDAVLYNDFNTFLAKPDPLASAVSSLKSWEKMKQDIKSSITDQLSQLKVAQKILKSISQ